MVQIRTEKENRPPFRAVVPMSTYVVKQISDDRVPPCTYKRPRPPGTSVVPSGTSVVKQYSNEEMP